MKRIINPPSLVIPSGYSHGIESQGGRTVYLAGQVAFDSNGKLVHEGNLVGQFERALANLRETLHAAQAEMTDIVKLLIFVKDKQDYQKHLKEIGGVYRTYFGRYFPAMSLVEVSNLFEDGALIEIEGIAVVSE
ncbi:MAG: RidA family protein [Bacteroidota bacterium]|nr:RidA family protein [Bacteroidota bacterium]MDP4233118.1 RidA family protein [Bacteroidota bacterium]MDP4241737.1 RidA family protein [Bacteroidota bacterium]MDP4287395.1 RidA family protein [Bacteroidota bacterium]